MDDKRTIRLKMLLVLVLLISTLTVIGVTTWTNRIEKTGEMIQEVDRSRMPVRTMVAQPKDITENMMATGLLKAEQDVIISGEVGGKVKKTFKELGDKCTAGELLILLDPEGYNIAMAQTKAVLDHSRVGLDHAQRDFKRMDKLKNSAVVTAQQYDGAEGAMLSGKASVAQAQAAMRLAKRNLRETKIKCPFDGVIAQRMVDTGQIVGPSTPLARLVDQRKLKLVLSVTSDKLARMKVGQRAILKDPSIPNSEYTGTVARLGVAADPRTRSFPVEVEVSDPEGLHTGQVVQVSIDLETYKDVIAVPADAIMILGDERSVMVVSKDLAKKVAVTLGPQIDEQVIVSGLKAGDEIIVMGGTNLLDGDKIEVVGLAPKKSKIGQEPETTK